MILTYRGGLVEDEDAAAGGPGGEGLDGEGIDEGEVLLEGVDGERVRDEASEAAVFVAVGGQQAGGAQHLLAGVEQVQAHDAVFPRQQDLRRLPPRHEHRRPPQHVSFLIGLCIDCCTERMNWLPFLAVTHEAEDAGGVGEGSDEGEGLTDDGPPHRAGYAVHRLRRPPP